MSERAENGPCSSHYSFVLGVGLVPSGPKSNTRRSMQPDLEEGEVAEVSSHLHSHSLLSARGNNYIVSSRVSSYSSHRQQRQAESPRSSEARDLASLGSRGPHDWHRNLARHEDRDVQRRRDRDDHYPSQSRSRSRSPGRRRGHSRDLFIGIGDADTDRSDSPAPSRAPSLDPLSPIATPEPRSPSLCQCPASDRCRCRPRDLYDCRTLVPVFQARAKGREPEYETV
jgi:hypothetical protein